MARRGRPNTGYVEKRGAGWGFRFVVPTELRDIIGAEKIRKPLKAATERDAREEAAPLAVEYQTLVRDLLALPVQTRKQIEIERWQEAARDFMQVARQTFLERPKLKGRLEALDADVYQAGERIFDSLARANGEMIAAAEQAVPMMPADVREAVEQQGVSGLYYRTAQMGSIARSYDPKTWEVRLPPAAKRLPKDQQVLLREALERDQERQVAEWLAEAERKEPLLAKLGLPLKASKKLSKRSNDSGILDAFDKWIAAEKQAPQTARKWRVHIRRLSEMFDDCDVPTLTVDHVEQYLEAVRALPDTRFLKVGDRNQPIQKLIELRKARPDLPPMGDANVRKAYEAVHAFLKFCKRKRWLKSNPAAEIEEKPKIAKRSKKDRRKGFTPAELRQILPALEQEFKPLSDITWWVHVLVYSGARPEEIGQLDRANVYQEQGVWVLDINEEDGRKTKNDNSVRTVPVHPRLIDRGFIAFATKGKGARVFSSFEKDTKGYYGGNEARRFMRFLRGRMAISDKRKVLYSTRHSFHTAMRNAGVPYDIQLALVGRLDEENVDHGDYGDTPLAAKVRWIGKIDPLAD